MKHFATATWLCKELAQQWFSDANVMFSGKQVTRCPCRAQDSKMIKPGYMRLANRFKENRFTALKQKVPKRKANFALQAIPRGCFSSRSPYCLRQTCGSNVGPVTRVPGCQACKIKPFFSLLRILRRSAEKKRGGGGRQRWGCEIHRTGGDNVGRESRMER